MLSGCAYYHPVAPPRADPTERSEGIRRNVEVGSLVRVEMSSGEKISGEVVSLNDEFLGLNVTEAKEIRTLAIRDIHDLTVKTWRKDDTVFFTVIGTGVVLLVWFAIELSSSGGFGPG
jgi:hypothetical protein